MQITFLGTACMQPTAERNHPGVLLTYKGEHILFDCGEGTQRQLKIAKVKPAKITKICVTHWHGDHCLGLPGLMQTMATSEFEGTLQIFGPAGTKKYMKNLYSWFSAQEVITTDIVEYTGKTIQVLHENKDYRIEALPMKHGTDCIGFSFVEADRRRINLSVVKKLGIPEGPLLGKLQQGHNVTHKGKTVTPAEATTVVKGKKIVYITDTLPTNNIITLAKDADLLILEATYHSALKEKADDYYHLTAKEAAGFASQAGVKKLILTHFSQRYKDVNEHEEEAKAVFPNTQAAFDFMEITIKGGD